MNEVVREIIEMVYDIAVEYWDIPNDDYTAYCRKLSELTREIWSSYHKELLIGLKYLDRLPRADYQMFWMDCISYPYEEKPKLHNVEGKPLEVYYGYLPSDFNDLSFHDSVIRDIQSEGNLKFTIDYFQYVSDVINKINAEICFDDVQLAVYRRYNSNGVDYEDEDIGKTNLSNAVIVSAIEVPAINFVYDGIGIDKNKVSIEGQRIFEFFFENENSKLIVICKDWIINK